MIKVEPETVSFGPQPSIGEQFTIDITLYDVADLFGWELKLFWDNSLLNCTAEEYPILPPGLNWESPNSLLLGPGIQNDYSETEGRWYHGLSALPMSPPMPESFTGTIKLATLTFEVLSQPSPNGTCILDLVDSKISDSNAISVDHEAIDGFYEILAAGLPRPELAIEPATRNTFTGGAFSVDVTISNVNASVKLVGVDVKIRFNPAMLAAIGATEGPFMMDPAWAAGDPSTQFFGPYFDGDYVGFGILLVPGTGGEWTLFPEGEGTLATITFNATVAGSCALELFDTKLSDPDVAQIKHTTVDGSVRAMEGAASPDINGDGIVDIFDIVEAVIAFGATPEHPRWNPFADINVDDIVDIYDIVLIARNFGKTV